MYQDKPARAMSPARQFRMNIQSQIYEKRRELKSLETKIKIASFLESHSENEMHEMIAQTASDLRSQC